MNIRTRYRWKAMFALKSHASDRPAPGSIPASTPDGLFMPTPESVLSWATEVANEWRWLAIVWHVALAPLLIAVVIRPPSPRLAARVLALPIGSVAVLAWISGNPFNGLAFTVLLVVLFSATRHLSRTPVGPASAGSRLAGAALVAFGWTYPHFLDTDTSAAYAYASPLGLLPCPTLSVVIGVTLALGGLQSRAWSLPLFAAGLLYGLIGIFRLRVVLDVPLLAGSVLLGALMLSILRQQVRATDHERTRRLPGDEFIPSPVGTLTHAITIAGPPGAVWPWLVQMGAGSRAGWYSYDMLDNRRQPSATGIVPELQSISVGTVFPALPGITEGFVVLAFEPLRSLILGWPDPEGSPTVSWAFVLEPGPGDTTRLIVRVRAGGAYRFHGLPVWLSKPAIELTHFVMERKQLLGIAWRVAG